MSDTPISDLLCHVEFIPSVINGEPGITINVKDLVALRDQCKHFEQLLHDRDTNNYAQCNAEPEDAEGSADWCNRMKGHRPPHISYKGEEFE